jgi:hypothetical protein
MKLRLPETLLILSALLCAGACSGATPTSPDSVQSLQPVPQPPPTPAAPDQTSVVDGRVVDEGTGQPLAAVKVDAVSGTVAYLLTTDATGTFRMQLPVGVARFRLSKEGYVSYDKEHTLQAGTTTLQLPLKKYIAPPQPSFPPPPYTYRGTITDTRGNPVADAEVVIYRNDSPIDGRTGRAVTDNSGRFTLISEQGGSGFQVKKRGYITMFGSPGPIAPDSSSTLNVSIPRIDRYVLTAPVSVKVGQDAEVKGFIELDNGSTMTAAGAVSSSNPSVLNAIGGSWVRGVAPGTATVTATFDGVTGTLQVRVEP